MKSLSVKLGVILIGLIIFGFAEVWGADWKFVQASRSPEEVEGLPVYAMLTFYDASSVVYPSKNIVKVWIKSFKIERGKNDTFPPEFEARPYEVLNSMKLFNITRLLEINCSERRFKSLKVFGSSGEGTEKEISKDIVPKYFQSEEISPEDEVDKLWKWLCRMH